MCIIPSVLPLKTLPPRALPAVVQGERRFYLGAVVDDLFLATPEWVYDGELNESTERRCTGVDLNNLLGVQRALNAQYPGSDVITEFAFNGGGIAEQVYRASASTCMYVSHIDDESAHACSESRVNRRTAAG